MKKGLDLQSIAIPFFSEANWHKAKSLMEDGHTFHDSYAEFVQRVVNTELQLKRQGQSTVRIPIEPEAFAQWCRAGKRKIDAQSRSTYAALMAAQNEAGGS